jgi:hypothetical protein
MQIRRGYSLLRATHQLELLAQLQPGSRMLATTRGSRYSGHQEASATVQLAHKLAPDHDAAVLEFALATSLHHDGITGAALLLIAHCRGVFGPDVSHDCICTSYPRAAAPSGHGPKPGGIYPISPLGLPTRRINALILLASHFGPDIGRGQ